MASMILTEEGAAFFINGKPYECSAEHINFKAVLEAAKASLWDSIPNLINIRTAIQEYVKTSEHIEVHSDYITYKGKQIHGTIVDRILTMIQEGFNATPMINFLDNLYQNPSDVAVKELYNFLVVAKLPITEDGHFLAYKRVNANYTSCHDGKTDNSIGAVLEMERSQVDSDRNNTCSYGFHFCSFDYLRSFSGPRTLILKINPRDVVAIPADYGDTKGRACRYLIEGEIDQVDENLLGQVGTVVKSSDEVPTADKYDNFARNAESAETDSPNDVVLGYDAGYRLGRYSKPVAHPLVVSDEYNTGYDQGVIDGKGHNVRKYAAPKK
jgi:hypothetical protein